MSESTEDAESRDGGEDGGKPTSEAFDTSIDPNVSPQFRWQYWSTVAAAVILVGTYVTWLWLLARDAGRPESLDFVMIIGLMFALVWTFGKDTAAAVKEFREGEEK